MDWWIKNETVRGGRWRHKIKNLFKCTFFASRASLTFFL